MTDHRNSAATHKLARSLALAVVALAIAACGSAAPSASPSASSAGLPPATPAASGAAATPATGAPSTGPQLSARPSECTEPSTAIALPSDRFTDIRVSTTADADRLTFVFGEPSLPGPAKPPMGELAATDPPYTFAASGAAITMTGDHVVSVGFSTMSLQNDAGQETYGGPPEVKPDLPALRQAVLYDASEGRIGWYVGYDGDGCLAFEMTGNEVTLTIGHP
jgi:hypothetical protein